MCRRGQRQRDRRPGSPWGHRSWRRREDPPRRLWRQRGSFISDSRAPELGENRRPLLRAVWSLSHHGSPGPLRDQSHHLNPLPRFQWPLCQPDWCPHPLPWLTPRAPPALHTQNNTQCSPTAPLLLGHPSPTPCSRHLHLLPSCLGQDGTGCRASRYAPL